MQKTLLSLLVVATVACGRNDKVVPTTTDPNWTRIDIPTGREAYAIAGDIDKTLLVTTWTKAYYSMDRGQTWQVSKDFQGPVPGLFVRNDTTFALQAFYSDQNGFPIRASLAQYFTPDYGRTWKSSYQVSSAYLDITSPVGQTQSATGVAYSIRNKLTPTAAGSSSFYINPSQIIRQEAAAQRVLDFTVKHKLSGIYLDAQNRLYVGASGGTYQAEHNTFYCCTAAMPAILYVSTKALP